MTKGVKTVAVLTARPGKTEALHALLGGMIAPSRSEPGNRRYDLWVDQTESGRFVLDELYVDDAAVAAHRASPHFQHYLSHIGDLAERMAFTLDAVTVS
ncbi:antibiotic biosynthesis monooxygenase [Sphingomonas sp. AP4-R1]|uniref:putative quinol monooxygenase n=1 Tax=Sphingomonas sp. AP4-R1 TaxID=2735134 RepID=UPI0014934572|nr:putative quinol monooxygenase [Sphingomonas sp. AP4-R1]QJU58137.1 antibiotic biosynthesis monooxygenase [Sphingomonas sp. AP4-R1]